MKQPFLFVWIHRGLKVSLRESSVAVFWFYSLYFFTFKPLPRPNGCLICISETWTAQRWRLCFCKNRGARLSERMAFSSDLSVTLWKKRENIICFRSLSQSSRLLNVGSEKRQRQLFFSLGFISLYLLYFISQNIHRFISLSSFKMYFITFITSLSQPECSTKM